MRKILPFIVLCYNATFSIAQSGHPDPTFGNGGFVRTDMGSPYPIQSSGKQVLADNTGSIYLVLDNPTSISKRFPDGSLDSNYGVDGYARVGLLREPHAALQADGKIVVAGKGFGMARINADGTSDSTFAFDERRYTELEGYTASAVNLASNGSIVVSGTFLSSTGETYFAVFRFRPDGTPDNTFNGNGQVITDFDLKWVPPGRGRDSVALHMASANAAIIQPDGKVVVAGFVQTGYHVDFAIVRYNTDGSLDATFDTDGRQYTQVGTSPISAANSIALQSDGKLVLAGRSRDGSFNRAGIVRYNANGRVDSTFNTNGTQTTGAASENWTACFVGLQADGKVVVAGTADRATASAFLLCRFNSDGSVDNNFDADGIITTSFGMDYANANSAIIHNDRIALVGEAYASSSMRRLVLSRYDPDGTPEDSFGDHGKYIEVSRQGNTQFNGTAVQTNGKVVTVGFSFNGTDNDFAIARYNVNGTPDSTFDGDGMQTTDFGGTDEGFSILIQPDGKIIVAGNSNNRFSLARYNADGSADDSFSSDGRTILPIGFADFCQSAALQADGKIIISGYSYNAINSDSSRLVIIRFTANGTLDGTFSQDGFLLADFGSYHNRGGFVAVQADGKIILAGAVFLSQVNLVLARYNIDGSIDPTFSTDGKELVVFGTDDFVVSSLALQEDGKIITAGYNQNVALGGYSFALARFLPNGVQDNSFSADGYQSSDFGPGLNFAASVAVRSDGNIAIGGVVNNNFAVALYQPGGDLENSFGDHGLQTTYIGLGESRIRAIAFSGTNLYAAGSGRFPASLGVVTKYLSTNLALPHDVLDFKAVLQNNIVLLTWKTNTYKYVERYIVERSGSGNGFVAINTVTAKGVSIVTRDYSSSDAHPLAGVNFYRLKAIDNAGNHVYSDIVAVKITGSTQLQLFPNPANQVLFVSVTGNDPNFTASIVDQTGKTVSRRKIPVNGRTYFSLNISGLPAGMYNLVTVKNGRMEVEGFVKQ